jgi:hypothetical protein
MDMSRGWESKDVEWQQDEAGARRAAARTQPADPERLRLESERKSSNYREPA